MENIKLTKDTISKIFGQEDSAQENGYRLNQYFVKNSAFADSVSDQNVVILVGHCPSSGIYGQMLA